MAESKKRGKSDRPTSGFHKGDTVSTNGQYDVFPKGTHGKVLDVDEPNKVLTVQLQGDPGEDTEAAVMEHPFSFFAKEKKKGRKKSA